MIDLIFQYINVAIVVFLAVYAFKRYLAPGLRGKQEQERLVEQNLYQEHDQLLQSQHELARSIEAQQAECSALIQRIDRWREEVETARSVAQGRQKETYEMLKKRLEQQTHNHALKKIQREVARAVKQKLESELHDYFRKQENVDRYMATTVDHLKRVHKL